jgi:hypothetical protein
MSFAAEDLIKNVRAHAIIWGPNTLTKEDHVSHLGRQSDHNHIPVISYSSTSPASCTFWIEDPVKASGGHPKFGFTLGSDSITFLNLKTDKRNGANLDCEGPRMKIAVPEKQGFKEFVDTTDPNNITGYSIDIFKASMETLYPIPCYDYSVFQGTYDELVGNVSSGVRLTPAQFHAILLQPFMNNFLTYCSSLSSLISGNLLGDKQTYAAAVGDVTITAERVTCTDFTMPYTQSGVSMLVLAEDEPNTIRWTFVEPLNWRLWFASLVFFLYTGFALWMIELPRNQEYQGSSLRQCSTALYFVFSTLTFSHG